MVPSAPSAHSCHVAMEVLRFAACAAIFGRKLL